MHLIPDTIGGCEETTTGVMRLNAMMMEGALKFPMITVNNARCKYLFDNRYGTGQSVWDGINRTTNLIVAGKNVVIAGYGWCGKASPCAAKASARIIVTETDPVKALEAAMDGFDVMPMSEAAKIGDLFITAIGCATLSHGSTSRYEGRRRFMQRRALQRRGGCQLSRRHAVKREEYKPNIKGYTLDNGRTLFVLAEGRLVNLASGDGHPVEIMDMSFAIQALSVKYLAENRGKIAAGVIPVPEEIDTAVARRKLAAMGLSIDSLTDGQKEYLGSWGV